jgi:GntR family transcriptional regulator, transcriptional repressor for pyruvate dehydrogenase complex
MDGINPIEGSKKPEQITKSLEKMILSKKFLPGEQLPSQKELAKRFNVGLRSIREALNHLEAKGLIEIQQGKGVFVKSGNLDCFIESITDSLGFSFPCTKHMLLALTDVRSIIETALVKSLASRDEGQTVDVLRDLIERMEACGSSPSCDLAEHQRLDALFHMQIVLASENPILVTLYKHLSRLLYSSMENSGRILANIPKAQVEHRTLLKAIEEHDVDTATAVITEHLENTRRTLEISLDDSDDPSGMPPS